MNFMHLIIEFFLVEDFNKSNDQNINKTSNVFNGIYLSLIVIFFEIIILIYTLMFLKYLTN